MVGMPGLLDQSGGLEDRSRNVWLRKFRAALHSGLCLVTGVGAGILYYLASESLAARSEATGEAAIAARIDSYCDAVQSWQSGTSSELENFLFFARLLGAAGQEVPCSLSSVPNVYDRPASEVSGGKCSDYEVKTVRCNVSELIPSPVVDSLYTIELIGKEPGRFTSTIGQAVIQVLTEHVWDLTEPASSPRHCGMGADFDCQRRHRQMFCEELQGQSMDDEYRACRAHHRLARASEATAPCWVMQPNLGIEKAFTFTDMQWPRQDGSVHPVTADAPFRCMMAGSGELSIQHMAATSLNTTPAAAMLEILDEAELTFRHHKDPFVVASQLTSSTFDMVLSEGYLKVSTVFFFMWAIILNCCCCGNSCKACDAATAPDAGDEVTAAADVIPSEAADPACCDRDSKPAEEDTPPESA
ncbi:hypothetical protein AK812_SmicGene32154 [Symbiodinium microadriaticum]|uniref:Uncharacterized protein n=1 Tax=Symbiodinium microadriaticum TaxID=2951 RepID=A0A1Q9CUY9_SYMMI|nr:hypothetical protein AK812_SmicGene32154 [Symbiodinium microadriaticum]